MVPRSSDCPSVMRPCCEWRVRRRASGFANGRPFGVVCFEPLWMRPTRDGLGAQTASRAPPRQRGKVSWQWACPRRVDLRVSRRRNQSALPGAIASFSPLAVGGRGRGRACRCALPRAACREDSFTVRDFFSTAFSRIVLRALVCLPGCPAARYVSRRLVHGTSEAQRPRTRERAFSSRPLFRVSRSRRWLALRCACRAACRANSFTKSEAHRARKLTGE